MKAPKASKPQKNRNFQGLIDLFRIHGAVSQSVLAQLSGLQPSTVSNHVGALRRLGALISEGKGGTSPEGGRPTALLALSPDFPAVAFRVADSGGERLCRIPLTGVPFFGDWVVSGSLDGDLADTSRLVRGLMHYHQVKSSLRTAPVLAVFGESFNVLACCFGDAQGKLVEGAHGKAGAWQELSNPDWGGLQRRIAGLARLLDPAAIALGGPLFCGIPADFMLDLAAQCPDISILANDADISGYTGTGWLLQDRLFAEMLYDNEP